jgi:adenine-specific DNA-methyltransferase
MDEVFGKSNCVSTIAFKKTSGAGSLAGGTTVLPAIADYLLWYAKKLDSVKYRQPYLEKEFGGEGASQYRWLELGSNERRPMTAREANDTSAWPADVRVFGADNLTSPTGVDTTRYDVQFVGQVFRPHPAVWKTSNHGMQRLRNSNRLISKGRGLYYVRYLSDFPARPLTNLWTDTQPGSVFAGADERVYVVQTTRRVVQRCLLMATDAGDLILDPTCGSGTTATVAEQWGRRWITIDTSRVALALARARIMGARYPYYLLADSHDGLRKEGEVSGRASGERPTHGNVRHGFVNERIPHITLKSIANNTEVDIIHADHQPKVQSALDRLNTALRRHKTPFNVTTGGRGGKQVQFDANADATFTMPSGEVVSASELVEWEVPREAPADWPASTHKPLADFWEARLARQKAIDASIASKAEFEFLYDRPYSDPKTVRVAGPFTVESLSPHRTLGVDEHDELIDPLQIKESGAQSFEQMILENLHAAGVQQAHKEGRITFEALTPWPGEMVCAEGRYREGDVEKRAAIFIGPEFGTVQRPDLVKAAREAGDAGFDVLIACAFNYEAHASEFSKLGRIPVLKARMNADLHMGGDLKPTGKGNLFVVFGEPDIEILHEADGRLMVHVKGVDVFDPTTGEVRSDGPDGIACWFIDTDYNEESFFVRHAYFLGQNDPYGALKTTLKAEIDADVWTTLNSAVSRPFPMPKSGRIAVKVINHLGDEVMKVFRVE